jgi:selenocysteine lyase/cysteine desulfurase
MAKLMHRYEGFCFVDLAASAPYVPINMHPKDAEEQLDAVFFSPHKFLGGPGSPGVMIFNNKLYKLKVPDHPGGGTVDWTNPWGEHRYIADIETRESGGTPPFLQTIKAALAVKLKETMGCKNMLQAEEKLVPLFMNEARKINRLHLLADHIEDRIGAVSLYFDDIHYNLIVKLLNDRFGIQVRGGCSCAGTYGHYLLNVDYTYSHEITSLIDKGDLSKKPGWVRFSLHPTMNADEVLFMVDALKQIEKNYDSWAQDYTYSSKTNEFFFNKKPDFQYHNINNWFSF